MLEPGIAEVDLTQFNGAVTILEPYQVPSDKALYAQNMAYLRGRFGTRYGSSSVVLMTDGAITAMRNWFFTYSGAQVSALLYYAPSIGLRRMTLGTFAPDTPVAVTGAAGAVIVPTGQRAYATFYDSTGRLGTSAGYVYGWNLGADHLFAAPLTNTPGATEPGAGVCTIGTHRIGYLTTTRNGASLKLSPVDTSVTFRPISFTSSGGKNIQVQIAGPWPSYMVGGTVQIVMTTVANPNRYYLVPGATSLAAGTVTITFSISDDDLAATGTDVTANVNYITEDLSANPPFKPVACFPYSSRMGYVMIDAAGNPGIAFSNPNAYQEITADQHIIQLENLQQPVQGFSLRGVCYIGATSGFFACEDNGGLPVSWTPPQRIDGSTGILSATCVAENPALGYALIAAEKGFYLFQGGVFPALPLSYYQDTDWPRINWNVPTQVQIGDDQLGRKFVVAAPLNTMIASVTGTGPYTVTTTQSNHLYQTNLSCIIAGVTGAQAITVTGDNTFTVPGGSGAPTVGGLVQPQTMNAEMTWDYTEGDTPETVKYSINSFTAFRAACLALVRNQSTLLKELWYGPAANGPIIRLNNGIEANPYRDVDMSGAAAAINGPYETALVPDPLQLSMTVHDFHGAHMAIRGNGSLAMIAKGLDGVITKVPAASPLTLILNPKKETLVKWALRSDRQSFRISTNAIDHFFVCSLIRMYYTDAFPQE